MFFCSSAGAYIFQRHCFSFYRHGCVSPHHQQMVPGHSMPETGPCPLYFLSFLPPTPPFSALGGSVIPCPRPKVTQNTLCLSADSWKVTLNDECSWVGLEGSFFIFFLSLLFLFWSPKNCITGSHLALFIRLLWFLDLSQLFCVCFLSRVLLAKQDV